MLTRSPPSLSIAAPSPSARTCRSREIALNSTNPPCGFSIDPTDRHVRRLGRGHRVGDGGGGRRREELRAGANAVHRAGGALAARAGDVGAQGVGDAVDGPGRGRDAAVDRCRRVGEAVVRVEVALRVAAAAALAAEDGRRCVRRGARLCLDEGVLSLVNMICVLIRDSP